VNTFVVSVLKINIGFLCRSECGLSELAFDLNHTMEDHNISNAKLAAELVERSKQDDFIAGYRIKPVRLGHAQLRQNCFYTSFETINQIRTPQTELNGVVLCPKLSSLVLG
jgi:hypothetical protein